MREKGGTMTIYVCFVALLLGTSMGQAAAEPPRKGPALLVSSMPALADLTELRIVLPPSGAGRETGPVDAVKLRAAVIEQLRGAGIACVEDETAIVPKLLVRMEGTPIPGSDKQVHRVQVSLVRRVILPDRSHLQIEAEVWQGVPLVRIMAKEETAGILGAGVLNRVQAFVDTMRAARAVSTPGLARTVSAPAAGQEPSAWEGTQTVSACPFVCSRNGQIFHRSDCRLARNIAAGNLIGYKSREEAVQAGKRPCKVCQP
jgi:hypothetical protein